MIEEIHIEGFRSLQEATLPLSKLNIIYGRNGSGKSSIPYACQVLKNVISNPNRTLDHFFNLGFVDLGRWDDIIFNHSRVDSILLSMKSAAYGTPVEYGVMLSPWAGESKFLLRGRTFESELQVDFPYAGNASTTFHSGDITFVFNGLSAEYPQSKPGISIDVNFALSQIKQIEVISTKRSMYSAEYPNAESHSNRFTEILAADEKGLLVERVNRAVQKMFGKEFRVFNIPGTHQFRMRTVKGDFITEFENEGFGLNQVVTMLIQLFKSNTTLALIEEPEIHLDPATQSALVDVFIEAIDKDKKQLFISTHSESMISDILNRIKSRTLSREDVQFFHCSSDKGETRIDSQRINDKGSLEGAPSYKDSEMENLKRIFES